MLMEEKYKFMKNSPKNLKCILSNREMFSKCFHMHQTQSISSGPIDTRMRNINYHNYINYLWVVQMRNTRETNEKHKADRHQFQVSQPLN